MKAFLTTPFDGVSNRLYPPEKCLQPAQKGSLVGPKGGSDRHINQEDAQNSCD